MSIWLNDEPHCSPHSLSIQATAGLPAAAHKLPDGRRAQTAHFQLFYYECKVPTNVTDVCPISNSPTTSATKLRMCVGGEGSGGLSVPRVWAEAAAVAVGGGRRAGMPAGRTTQRRRAFDGCSRLWESVLRRRQQRCAIGVRAAGVCSPPPLFAPGGRAEASGGGASGGRGARRSRSAGAEVPPCAAAAAKVPAAMMWRELCAGGERGGCTSRLDQRDSASLTIATALA